SRQMKIGHEAIDDFESVWWINKNVRPSGARVDDFALVLYRTALEHAQGRSADCEHPASAPLRSLDLVRCLRRQLISLLMHAMGAQVFNFDRRKRSGPDVQRDEPNRGIPRANRL